MGLYPSYQAQSDSTQIGVTNNDVQSTLHFASGAQVYFQNQTGDTTTFTFSNPSYFVGSPSDTGSLDAGGNSKTYTVAKGSTAVNGDGYSSGVWQDIDYGTLDPSDGDGKPYIP